MIQALLQKPEDPVDWYYLGRIRYSYSAFDEARKAFEQALRLNAKYLKARYNLALAYEGLGNDERAAEIYRQAIDQVHADHLTDAQPSYDLGLLLVRHNEPARALPLLEEAATLDAKNPGVREGLAKVEEQLGDLKASKQNLEAAVRLAPQMFSVHFELGRIDRKLHLDVEAKREFDLSASLHAAHQSSDEGSSNFSDAPSF
jgi:tetratricopeptide (TPR) repeat protein